MSRQPPQPPEIVRRVSDGPHMLTVTLQRDRRLRTSARWSLKQSALLVRVPARLPQSQVDDLLDEIVAKVLKQRRRARKQNDRDLEKRARALNHTYFDGELAWHTIRWSSSMTTRLGSCTSGGTTDGDIRISERLRMWPSYVLDYVIAHELVHRQHPNHSPAFWDYLARYPFSERARGFIEGVEFNDGLGPVESVDSDTDDEGGPA